MTYKSELAQLHLQHYNSCIAWGSDPPHILQGTSHIYTQFCCLHTVHLDHHTYRGIQCDCLALYNVGTHSVIALWWSILHPMICHYRNLHSIQAGKKGRRIDIQSLWRSWIKNIQQNLLSVYKIVGISTRGIRGDIGPELYAFLCSESLNKWQNKHYQELGTITHM